MNNEKIMVRFFKDFGRSGELEGLFLTSETDLESLYDSDIYFGEVLGKHSEVEIRVRKEHFTKVTDDLNIIRALESLFPSGTICGYNPFDYQDE